MEHENRARRLAGLADVLADTTRLRILETLLAGEATVSDLAARLALPQPRVSAHLARLRRAGLIQTIAAGRQRTCGVDADRVRPALEALGRLAGMPDVAPRRSAQAERLVRNDAPMRQARRCYDHLAGVAGVGLLDELLARGWLTPAEARPGFVLSPAGSAALEARGVDVAAAIRARRRFATACLDWTERRPHLGGALGAAILGGLLQAKLATACDGDRALRLHGRPIAWLEGTAAGRASAGGTAPRGV
ncbi:MAG TPA: metalloregulator ArsR/SmtB family transcription factor [Dehalococcoidia bacterium]|nr:metalloregulator ArsR/SmtB family transcription factor [Dehalococcoidia bacterium]